MGRHLDPHRWGWRYLALVIDLASRHLLDYSERSHHDATLGLRAAGAAAFDKPTSSFLDNALAESWSRP